MHLVDNVDLKSALSRRILTVVAQSAHLLNTIVGSTIDLDHIHAGTTHDGLADLRFIIWRGTGSAFGIERFGKQARSAGLTCAARPDKKIGVCNTLGINRIA